MMRFKVGDCPTIRRDLEIGVDYGNNDVAEEMIVFRGKIVTITDTIRQNTNEYSIEEDGGTWLWTDDMFE